MSAAGLIVGGVLLVLSSLASAQSNPCSSIQNDAERLACYDAAAKRRPASPAKPGTDKVPTAWKIVETRDRLSNKVTNHAESSAVEQFTQRGEPVTASLIVYCSRLLKGDPGQFHAHVWFSSVVAVGRTSGRVRIDERPVQAIHPNSYSRGQTIEVFFPGHEAMAPLFASKRLRVEYDLPFAGKVLLEFPTVGAKEAFSKLTCRDPEL